MVNTIMKAVAVYLIYNSIILVSSHKTTNISTSTTSPVSQTASYNTTTVSINNTQWVSPTAWSVTTFPNPQIDVDRCGRKRQQSYICDPTQAVAYEDGNILDHMIYSIRKESKCPCGSDCPAHKDGYVFSLAIIPKLEWKDDVEETDEMKQKFADDLRKSWNFGHCENDVLILIITKATEKNFYSSIGSKAKEVLTEECSKKFQERAQTFFTSKVWALGLESMLEDYGRNIYKGHCKNTWGHGSTAGLVLGSLFAIIVLVSVVFMIIECIRRRYHEIRRKRKFHYAPSYSTAAVAQRRFPTSHSWSALRSNQHISGGGAGTSARNLVTTGFAGLSGRMKINNPRTSDDKEGLNPNVIDDGETTPGTIS